MESAAPHSSAASTASATALAVAAAIERHAHRPGALLPLVILLEMLGGVLLMLGWHTRIVAFLLAGFTILATLIFHSNIGDQTQFLFFMKNLSIAGGLLLVVSHGAGPYSVDNRQRS